MLKKPITFDTLIAVSLVTIILGSIAGYGGAELRSKLTKIESGEQAPSVGFSPFIGGGEQEGVDREPQPPPPREEDVVIAVARRASPAVVSIVISLDQPILERSVRRIQPFGENSPFVFEVPQTIQNGTKRQVVGGGTGFFVSSDGYILTNRHVASRADAFFTVVTNDGKEYEAKVLDRDPVNDLAVLKVEGGLFPTALLGNSDTIQIGQRAIAIGYALGEFQNTVSVGVISGLGRNIRAAGGGQVEALEGLIQTDAAINPGNSGGPLMNTKGEVIGVNVATSEGAQNIGFAIPVNAAKPVVESVKQFGRIVRPQLGVRYALVTPEIATKNGLTVNYGALLVAGENGESGAVVVGSPAEKAGLKAGDIILEIDGTRIDKDHSLASLITKHKVGETIRLKYLRDGKEVVVSIVLEEWKR